jgi:hypothetical protein
MEMDNSDGRGGGRNYVWLGWAWAGGGGMDHRDLVEPDGPSDGARTGGCRGPGFFVAGWVRQFG